MLTHIIGVPLCYSPYSLFNTNNCDVLRVDILCLNFLNFSALAFNELSLRLGLILKQMVT